MTAARQVLIEVDDLERLLELADQPDDPTILPAGWVAFGPNGEGPLTGTGQPPVFDVADRRLVERVRREVLGR